MLAALNLHPSPHSDSEDSESDTSDDHLAKCSLTRLNVVNGGSHQLATPKAVPQRKAAASAAHAHISMQKVTCTRTTFE